MLSIDLRRKDKVNVSMFILNDISEWRKLVESVIFHCVGHKTCWGCVFVEFR